MEAQLATGRARELLFLDGEGDLAPLATWLATRR